MLSPAGARTDVVSTISGTPGYMSPEQALGRPADHRSDIYSLSLVVFEMLSGRRAVAATDLQAAATVALNQRVPHVRTMNPAISPELDALVASGLATDPADRPQTALAYATALSALRTSNATPPRWPRAFAYVAAVLIVAAVAGVAATWRVWRRAPASPRPVIAVLPLANLSGDASKDYLGVGIADTLTTSLARLSSVSVVTRDGDAAKSADVAKMARALGATLVVQGSVQTVGDRLHVNAKLVRPDGVVAWAGDADATQADLFGLESRLAGALVDGLEVNVTAAERQNATRPPTTDRDALDDYWRGVALIDRNDPASATAAIEALGGAIRRDPNFALAHAALGDAYRAKYGVTNDRVWMDRALAEVTRALALDPGRADVRVSLAVVYRDTGRAGAAVDELRRVLQDQPANDNAHRLLGEILASQGRNDDAVAELQQAIALRPQYWRNYSSLGLVYLGIGRLNEAVTALRRRADLRPDDPSSFQQLGVAYQSLGDLVSARTNYEHAIALQPSPPAYTNLGVVHYAEHRYADAVAAFEAAVKMRPNRALYRRNLGDGYAKVGRRDAARAEYEKAVALAREQLAVNPADAATTSQLAVYEAKAGRSEEAVRDADAAITLNPTSVDILYRRAVVLAIVGRKDEALRALADAIGRGYSKAIARDDDDFTSLRDDKEFRAVTGGQ